VTTDSAEAILGDAWGRIPHTRETNEGYGTFTQTRIERIIELIVGLGCLALGAQGFVAALAGGEAEIPAWHVGLTILTFVPLAVMILMCGIGRAVKVSAAVFAIAYVVVLLLWPLATAGPQPADSSLAEPWIFYLINVATGAATLAFALPLQIAWAAVTPVLFGVVRLIQGEFHHALWFGVSLDVSLSLILGGIIVTLPWVFRSIAVGVDEARARAVASYAAAAAADAAERERVAVAGLMHDSVLAALIAAERATTPRERALAVSMAREALTRLANTDSTEEERSDEPVSAVQIARELERVSERLGLDNLVTCDPDQNSVLVPGRVARALTLAATQAVTNAVQHADAIDLRVQVTTDADTGVSVVVSDGGPGFDVAAVAPDRLGIRGSIVARLAAVGGYADVSSGPHGTSVALTWKGPS
jgi:signal transduction histidine kinase